MDTLSYKKDKKLLTFTGRQGELQTIGSKLYPLSQKKKIGLWTPENTEETKRNQMLMRYLDAVEEPQFTIGKCYRNAEAVRQLGERLNLNIKFYSGWLFDVTIGGYPLHHAWNVLDNRIIIDTSMQKSYFSINQIMMQYAVDNPNILKDKWREKYVEVFEEKSKNKKPISQELLFGNVPEWLVYVGTEDTYENAQNIISTLLEEVDDHPSYPHYRNEAGESPTQILLKEKGLFR